MIRGKDDPFWDITLGKEGIAADESAMTGSLYAQQTNPSIELTLSLRKDDKETLFRAYVKILKAIDSIYSIDKHVGFWEKGMYGHRHIHSKITFKGLPVIGYPIGLVQEIAHNICWILRRQYNEKHLFVKQLNYTCVPFKIQYGDRLSWDEYICKDGKPINISKLCNKYKIYYKL